jgi:peroxiredoxin
MTATETLSEQSLQQQLETFKQQLATQAPQAVAQFDAEIARLIQSGPAGQALKVGAVAPDFTLPDATGQAVTLSTLLAHGPVVLVFYRGEWCPYCNLALRAYQRIQPHLAVLGATMVAVSPQTPDNSLTTVEKKELTFPVLSDQGNSVARQYGAVFAYSEAIRSLLSSFGTSLATFNGDDSWELPFPGVFIIAPDRTVIFAQIEADWTMRTEPETILASLRQYLNHP